MFWNNVAGMYDLFEDIYNRRVYRETGKRVAEHINVGERVLECACGTGAISTFIAEKGARLTATDYAEGMLKQAGKKLAAYPETIVEKADITALHYEENSFDVVVAGNVIHLLTDPFTAMKELERVCRPNGRMILPTYINGSRGTNRLAVRFLEKLGADFKRQFDEESYRMFFKRMGYDNAAFEIVEGRMPCDIAILINYK